MTDLVACISSGKGTIAHVSKLIEGQNWEKVYIITNNEFKDQVSKKDNINIILIDNKKSLPEMVEDLKHTFKGKLKMTETAVNLISGDGKEHMALISALLKLGIGIRLVALTKEGVKEI